MITFKTLKQLLSLLLAIGFSIPSSASTDLRTIAEITNWKQTGRADETESLCKSFAKKYPERVKCSSYGVTPEGRNLMYLVVSDHQNKLNQQKSPVIWIQAGIHSGEIDGKDAVFLLLREALTQELKPDPFKGLTFVFIPIVNLDGHERFGKWNRPNQVGPEEMGWRTTAQNLNMNRDFTKLDAPETKALLKLWHQFDPIFSADLHVTDGAQFQPEVGLIVSPTDQEPSELQNFGKLIESNLVNKMKNRSHLALPYYPDFEKTDQPLSGFSRSVSTPRFSQSYWSNQNRLGMLVESHSWKDYATRVHVHHDVVLSVLELAQKDAAKWIKAAKILDENKLSEKPVSLEFKHTDLSHPIDFPGYHYTKEKSEISSAESIHYFPEKPEIWHTALFDEVKPSLTITAPKNGYLIPPSEAEWMIKKLDVHGIKYSIYKKEAPSGLEVFRATGKEFSPKSYEGHQTLSVKGEWKAEKRSIAKGSIFVSIDQPHARLLMQILEPLASDSFASWGFFNRFFEQKEYMEDYVTEVVAKEMLSKDPEMKKEFYALLKSDPSFEKDSKKRLEFFYKRHPSYDERFNLYPVYRF